MSDENLGHGRGAARSARTREALIAAGQQLLAEGRIDVPILEITRLAGVGLGSFYNHFSSRDEFNLAALDAAADAHGRFLAGAAGHSDDPAEAFSQRFRLTGRVFRAKPYLTGAIVSHVADYYARGRGLVASLRLNLEWGVSTGRFLVGEVEGCVGTVVGAMAMLGQRALTDPSLDVAAVTDALCLNLLRMLGIPADEAAVLVRQPLADLPAPHPPAAVSRRVV